MDCNTPGLLKLVSIELVSLDSRLRPWQRHLLALNLSFPTCKMGIN